MCCRLGQQDYQRVQDERATLFVLSVSDSAPPVMTALDAALACSSVTAIGLSPATQHLSGTIHNERTCHCAYPPTCWLLSYFARSIRTHQHGHRNNRFVLCSLGRGGPSQQKNAAARLPPCCTRVAAYVHASASHMALTPLPHCAFVLDILVNRSRLT
jgi:hypothetical protein